MSSLNSQHTFSKDERICSKITIEQLFAGSASTLLVYPLRALFMPIEKETKQVMTLISVPKKRFKRAVDRNRIKRQIREAYRMHKQTLVESLFLKEKGLAITFLYIANEKKTTEEVSKSVNQLLAKITIQMQ